MRRNLVLAVLPLALVVGCGNSSKGGTQPSAPPSSSDPNGTVTAALQRECTTDAVSRAAFFDTLKKDNATIYTQDLATFKRLCPGVTVETPDQAIENDLASHSVGP